MHQKLCLFSDAQAERFGNPISYGERPGKKTKQSAMKCSQIHQRIELYLYMREIILRFHMDL
jgi:hypothetical protein